MAKITTESGFSCEIDDSVINDAELLDIMLEWDEGNLINLTKACHKMLRDGYKRLYDHVRTPDGRVPLEAIAAEMGDIIKGLSASKK